MTEPTPQEAAIQAALDAGVTLGAFVRALADRDNDERAERIIAAAREEHHVDGEVEIDDTTIVSGGEEHGDYVLAWVWTRDPAPEDDEDEDDEPPGSVGPEK